MWIQWVIWAVLTIAAFGWLEAHALNHSKREWTLSKFVAYLGAKWPLTIFFFGLVTGGLAVHFFWRWCS